MTPTALRISGGIAAYLAPRIAADAKLPPIAPLVRDVSRTNFGAKKNQIASRIRYQMRGRIALDADLDDLMDLLDALEEIGESEEMEGEDRGSQRGRDNDPLDREENLYEGLDTDPNGFGSNGWNTATGEGPSPLYDTSPLDCTDERTSAGSS